MNSMLIYLIFFGMNDKTYQCCFHAWCHPELVSGSAMRGSSSTADPDIHQDDTVDDDYNALLELVYNNIPF